MKTLAVAVAVAYLVITLQGEPRKGKLFDKVQAQTATGVPGVAGPATRNPGTNPKEGKMEQVTVAETEASGIAYPVTFPIFESLAEASELMDGGEEAILDNVNAKQRQSALQSPKGTVRDAVNAAREAGFSDEEIQQAADEGSSGEEALQGVCDAIAHHQEVAAEFILGSPRGGSDGVNKTTAREVGERITAAMDRDPDQLRELADQLGVDVSDLL